MSIVPHDSFHLPLENCETFLGAPGELEGRNESPYYSDEYGDDVYYFEMVSDIGAKSDRFRISKMGLQAYYEQLMDDMLIEEDLWDEE